MAFDLIRYFIIYFDCYLLHRSYNTPLKPTDAQMEIASRDFVNGIQTSLKGKSFTNIYVNMELDVWRYVTYNRGTPSEHKDYTMYSKEDFDRFEVLPCDWYYNLNQHGQGTAIDFPVKAKPVVSWSASRYNVINGKLEKAARMPLEKISVSIVKRACDINNI